MNGGELRFEFPEAQAPDQLQEVPASCRRRAEAAPQVSQQRLLRPRPRRGRANWIVRPGGTVRGSSSQAPPARAACQARHGAACGATPHAPASCRPWAQAIVRMDCRSWPPQRAARHGRQSILARPASERRVGAAFAFLAGVAERARTGLSAAQSSRVSRPAWEPAWRRAGLVSTSARTGRCLAMRPSSWAAWQALRPWAVCRPT